MEANAITPGMQLKYGRRNIIVIEVRDGMVSYSIQTKAGKISSNVYEIRADYIEPRNV